MISPNDTLLFDPDASKICVEDWCWESPYPHGRLNRAVWGSSAADVWVVGEGPTLHFDGEAFAAISVPAIGERRAVWGTGPADVWIVGTDGTAHFDGSSWTATTGVAGTDVHGSGPDDVWVVGLTAVHQWDGTSWSAVAEAPPGDRLLVQSATSRWILADRGWRYDGSTWVEQPWAEPGRAIDAFSLGSDAMWVVTANFDEPPSTALHRWDGSAFTTVPSPPGDGQVTGVWAAGPNDLWVTTTDEIWHSSGGDWIAGPWPEQESWSDYLRPPLVVAPLSGATGFGPADVWAVGELGQIIHFDGETWTHLDSRLPLQQATERYEHPVWYDQSGLWLAHGAGLVRLEATRFETFTTDSATTLWGDGTGSMWAVGGLGGWDYIARVQGQTVETFDTGDGTWMTAISGTGPGNIWAGGDFERVLRWTGESWAQMSPSTPLGLGSYFVSVSSTAPDDTWAAEMFGHVYHWDGGSWVDAGRPETGSSDDAVTVHAVSADCVWLALDHFVASYTNPCVSPFPTEGGCWGLPQGPLGIDARDLYAVACNEAWVVGDRGAIWHIRDEQAETIVEGAITGSNLHTLRRGPDGRLFAFGDDGVVLSHE